MSDGYETSVSTIILGGGMAGLGAATTLWTAGQDFRVLEASYAPGGLVRTDILDGFSFEPTCHFLHFKSPELLALLNGLNLKLNAIKRNAAIALDHRIIPYPFQYNLWALDPLVARNALSDLRQARNESSEESPRSFADVLLRSWGQTITELFFRPYTEKLWQVSLEALPADCTGQYHPQVDLALAEQGACSAVAYDGYNSMFFYPASGRLGDVACALAQPFQQNILCSRTVSEIDLRRRVCLCDSGETLHFSRLISTLPLHSLLKMSGIVADEDQFAFTEVVNIRLGFRGSVLAPYHWIYVADRHIPFYRVGMPSNVSRNTCPPGGASLSLEYTIPRSGARYSAGELAQLAVDYLSSLGLIRVEELCLVDECVLSPAYVLNRSEGRAEFHELRNILAECGVGLAGRYGVWDYFSIEDSFVSGMVAGRNVLVM